MKKIPLFVAPTIVALAAMMLAGSAGAQDSDPPPFIIIYVQPNAADPGPDIVYEIPAVNLVCAKDGDALSCTCKCTNNVDCTVSPGASSDPSLTPPTITPPPTTPPPPTQDEKCNNGLGNGPDCPPPGHDKDGDGQPDDDKGDNDDDKDKKDCGGPGDPCNNDEDKGGDKDKDKKDKKK